MTHITEGKAVLTLHKNLVSRIGPSMLKIQQFRSKDVVIYDILQVKLNIIYILFKKIEEKGNYYLNDNND